MKINGIHGYAKTGWHVSTQNHSVSLDKFNLTQLWFYSNYVDFIDPICVKSEEIYLCQGFQLLDPVIRTIEMNLKLHILLSKTVASLRLIKQSFDIAHKNMPFKYTIACEIHDV